MDAGAALIAVDWLVTFAARAREEAGWELRTLDLGGGLGVPTAPASRTPRSTGSSAALLAEFERALRAGGLPGRR